MSQPANQKPNCSYLGQSRRQATSPSREEEIVGIAMEDEMPGVGSGGDNATQAESFGGPSSSGSNHHHHHHQTQDADAPVAPPMVIEEEEGYGRGVEDGEVNTMVRDGAAAAGVASASSNDAHHEATPKSCDDAKDADASPASSPGETARQADDETLRGTPIGGAGMAGDANDFSTPRGWKGSSSCPASSSIGRGSGGTGLRSADATPSEPAVVEDEGEEEAEAEDDDYDDDGSHGSSAEGCIVSISSTLDVVRIIREVESFKHYDKESLCSTVDLYALVKNSAEKCSALLDRLHYDPTWQAAYQAVIAEAKEAAEMESEQQQEGKGQEQDGIDDGNDDDDYDDHGEEEGEEEIEGVCGESEEQPTPGNSSTPLFSPSGRASMSPFQSPSAFVNASRIAAQKELMATQIQTERKVRKAEYELKRAKDSAREEMEEEFDEKLERATIDIRQKLEAESQEKLEELQRKINDLEERLASGSNERIDAAETAIDAAKNAASERVAQEYEAKLAELETKMKELAKQKDAEIEQAKAEITDRDQMEEEVHKLQQKLSEQKKKERALRKKQQEELAKLREDMVSFVANLVYVCLCVYIFTDFVIYMYCKSAKHILLNLAHHLLPKFFYFSSRQLLQETASAGRSERVSSSMTDGVGQDEEDGNSKTGSDEKDEEVEGDANLTETDSTVSRARRREIDSNIFWLGISPDMIQTHNFLQIFTQVLRHNSALARYSELIRTEEGKLSRATKDSDISLYQDNIANLKKVVALLSEVIENIGRCCTAGSWGTLVYSRFEQTAILEKMAGVSDQATSPIEIIPGTVGKLGVLKIPLLKAFTLTLKGAVATNVATTIDSASALIDLFNPHLRAIAAENDVKGEELANAKQLVAALEVEKKEIETDNFGVKPTLLHVIEYGVDGEEESAVNDTSVIISESDDEDEDEDDDDPQEANEGPSSREILDVLRPMAEEAGAVNLRFGDSANNTLKIAAVLVAVLRSMQLVTLASLKMEEKRK